MDLIPLQHNRPVRIAGAMRIECVLGTVWLTRTGGAGDHFLRAGDSCILASTDEALVEALGQAQLRLQRLDRVPAPGRRLLARAAAVLSSLHDRMCIVRFFGRRATLAG